MDWLPDPPSDLLRAQLFLGEIDNFSILETLKWYKKAKEWAIKFQISLPNRGHPFRISDWYLTLDDAYPDGDISIYPAKQNGLSETYPHQLYNLEGEDDLPWRSGKICTTTQNHVVGLHGHDIEPHTVDGRLEWHGRRAVEWVHCASTDRLTIEGEPFELPLINPHNFIKENIYFSEDGLSLLPSQDKPFLMGYVSSFNIKNDKNSWFLEIFKKEKKENLISLSWGHHISRLKDQTWGGIWLTMRSLPIVKPYRFPETWSELKQIFSDQSISSRAILRVISKKLRDGKPHFILIGFPISSTYGGPLSILHWLAIKLPTLSFGKGYKNGFRANEQGYFENDIRTIFHNNSRINYMKSENWHSNQIQNRGRFEEALRKSHIGIIGCGSLGAPITEMFIRGGVSHLTVIDDDIVEIGNLTRHTLSLNDIGKEKAIKLAEHINSLNPHAKVDCFSSKLSSKNKELLTKIEKFDFILDCTASNEVLSSLAKICSEKSIHFCSVSVGIYAKKMFFFYTKKTSFPFDFYRAKIAPWVKLERTQFEGKLFPREGIGCFHPVFPARCDDMWLWASLAAKLIAKCYQSHDQQNIFHVYEQKEETDGSISINRLTETCDE